jgi:fatty-acid desaturase
MHLMWRSSSADRVLKRACSIAPWETSSKMKVVRTLNPKSIVYYILMHLGALLCFLVPATPVAMTLSFGLYLLSGISWSVGIHRGLIHRSYETSRTLENLLAFLGSLAGLGGPIASSRVHFVRDYYQSRRGIAATDYPNSFWKNYFTLPFFCDTKLVPAPRDRTTDRLQQRWFFRMLERRWTLSLVIALLLYVLDGVGGVVWGLLFRAVVTGNIFACFDFFCHSPRFGRQRFTIEGASNEGRNQWLLGLITWGEGWHNNHHAMPTSPRMGSAWYELDFGYATICLLARFGLVWNLQDSSKAMKANARPIVNLDSGLDIRSSPLRQS